MSKAPAPRSVTPPEPRLHGAEAPPPHWAARRRAARMRVRHTLLRCMDLLVSGIALVLLAPLLVVVAILVVADSPGPVLSRQARIGRGGRKFRLLSFRTTTNGSEVTRIGTTLQRYAIDEFPRLWNVLIGDISLIILWRAAQTGARPIGAH